MHQLEFHFFRGLVNPSNLLFFLIFLLKSLELILCLLYECPQHVFALERISLGVSKVSVVRGLVDS